MDIVTCGWDLSGWEREFYPPDLPADWRLTYFANEFPAVMMPRAYWAKADESSLRVWSEDVPEDFRFYLQTSGIGADLPGCELAREGLGAKLAGLVSPAGATPPLPASCFQIPGQANALPEGGCLPAWRVPDACARDLRAGRAWLESLNTQGLGGPGLLVLANDDIRAEDLRRWWHLLWLMGAA